MRTGRPPIPIDAAQVEALLRENKGVVTRVARILGVNRNTIYRKFPQAFIQRISSEVRQAEMQARWALLKEQSPGRWHNVTRKLASPDVKVDMRNGRPPKPIDFTQIKSWCEDEGLSWAQIAKRAGVHRNTITKHLSRPDEYNLADVVVSLRAELAQRREVKASMRAAREQRRAARESLRLTRLTSPPRPTGRLPIAIDIEAARRVLLDFNNSITHAASLLGINRNTLTRHMAADSRLADIKQLRFENKGSIFRYAYFRTNPLLNYPYITCAPTAEHELVLAVNALVPEHLPHEMRADLCQDLIVAVLSGEMSLDNLQTVVPSFIRRHYKQYPSLSRFADLSLDAPRQYKNGDTYTLGEMIAAEYR